MSKNISQITTTTSSNDTDLYYKGESPFGSTNDRAITWASMKNNIVIAESQVTNLTTDLASKLPLSGGTMTGNLLLNADATLPMQAVTYEQFQATIAGFTPKAPCYAATTTNLAGTYNNGSSGVGATFTLTATGTFTTDGVTPPLNSRIYILNQTNAIQNGIYTLTTTGNGSTQAVLTRATDYDNHIAGEVVAGVYASIQNGTTYGGTTYYLTTSGTITIGTSPLTYAQLMYVMAGTGLTQSAPNTLSVNMSALVIGENQVTNLITDLNTINTNISNLQSTKQNENANLSSLSVIPAATNGIVVKTNGLGTAWAVRGVTSVDGSINVTDGDGVAGNIDLSVAKILYFNSQSSNYTLQSSDNQQEIIINSASSVTVTIPSTLFSGFSCRITQGGAGQVTIIGSGVTINAPNSAQKLRAQNASALVRLFNTTSAYIDGTLSVSGNAIPIVAGGTNATSFSSVNGLISYNGTSLVSSSAFQIDSSNRVTNTAQPAFSAYLNADQANVTGDGTGYIVAFANTKYDQNSNFNTTTYTFTAPVTGKYKFGFSVALGSLTSSNTSYQITLVTSGGNYDLSAGNAATMKDFNNNLTVNGQAEVPMTAADTAKIQVVVYNGTKTTTVRGLLYDTTFSGHLIC